MLLTSMLHEESLQILTGFTKVLYCCKTPTRSLSLSVISLFNLTDTTDDKMIFLE